MRQFLLFALASMLTFYGTAQTTTVFTTATSGNFNSPATWSGGVAPPVNCDCKIRILAGHAVTISTAVNLTNAIIELNGSGINKSQLLFSGSNDLTLSGVSEIDVQNPDSRIFSSNQNNSIVLSTIEIFKGKNTKMNSTVDGEILGPASASSKRTNVNFINSVLPVTLTSFSVINTNKNVSLTWQTELEINSDEFQVQRSQDGKNWIQIGVVKASGNISTTQKYNYIDGSPVTGVNYYRLKIVDIDLKFEYSPVKTINIISDFLALEAVPNPASSSVKVSVNQPNTEPFRLKLINRSGQILYDQKFSGATSLVTIPVTAFAEGAYFLEVTNQSGGRRVNKIMILRNR